MADEKENTKRVLVTRAFSAGGKLYEPGQAVEVSIDLYRDLIPAGKAVAEADATPQHKVEIEAYRARRADRGAPREKAISTKRAGAERAANA